MTTLNFGTMEARFADIIWKLEPIQSSKLVAVAESELNWKKSTTYTVLKRLCEKGIFKNEKAMVTSVISRDDYFSLKSIDFVKNNFNGSLPMFLAAFSSKQKLSKKDIEEINNLINSFANSK